MPQALDVDWAAVRTLAVAVGMAEAARQMGISHDAVRQRASREGWADDPRVAAVMRRSSQEMQRKPLSQPVTSAAQAMAESMRKDAVGGRAAALRVTRRALERADRYDDDELMVPEVAGVIHSYVKSAATAGGYGASDAVARVDLRITADRSVEPPPFIDAEWAAVETEAVREQSAQCLQRPWL